MTTSKIQMDQIRSTSATVAGENIRAGSQKKSSLSPAEGLQGESPDATCTCPSGGGSLRHPCPAHPAVEQAGGDERDLQGAQGERDGWGPFPIVQVPWNVFDRAVMWVEDRRRYGDDGTIVDDWKALKTIQRAALAQPSPKCATCNGTGQIVVSGPHYCGELQPPEYETEPCDMCSQPSPAQADEKPGDSILCYGCFAKGVGPDHFDEAGKCLAAQAEQAEAERPEMSSERAAYFMRRFKSEEKLLGPNEQAAVDYVLSLIAQHERIVGDLQRQKHEADTALAWATRHYQTVEQERDAALAKLAELEAKLSDPTAVHQWQFSNAWFDGSEEVVLKAGKEGSPIRTLYTAPVAQAQHSVPEGWRLVPIEPTPEMLDARRDCEDGIDGYLVEDTEYYFPDRSAVRNFLARVYHGMLAAAPGNEGV